MKVKLWLPLSDYTRLWMPKRRKFSFQNFSSLSGVMLIKIHISSFKKLHLKMSPAKCRPSSIGPIVLKIALKNERPIHPQLQVMARCHIHINIIKSVYISYYGTWYMGMLWYSGRQYTCSGCMHITTHAQSRQHDELKDADNSDIMQ